jgi:hypothetical protein
MMVSPRNRTSTPERSKEAAQSALKISKGKVENPRVVVFAPFMKMRTPAATAQNGPMTSRSPAAS